MVYFFNSLKNHSLLKKSTSFSVPYNKKVLRAAELFYKEGFITSYSVSSGRIIVYIFGVGIVRDIEYYYKKNLRLSLSYKDVCRIDVRKTNLFLSTSKGMKNIVECKKERLGGVLKFKL